MIPAMERSASGRALDRGKVPRDDVAAVVAATLHEPATIGQLFELVDGDDPIDDVLQPRGFGK